VTPKDKDKAEEPSGGTLATSPELEKALEEAAAAVDAAAADSAAVAAETTAAAAEATAEAAEATAAAAEAAEAPLDELETPRPRRPRWTSWRAFAPSWKGLRISYCEARPTTRISAGAPSGSGPRPTTTDTRISSRICSRRSIIWIEPSTTLEVRVRAGAGT
jgi:hypothetical protein